MEILKIKNNPTIGCILLGFKLRMFEKDCTKTVREDRF